MHPTEKIRTFKSYDLSRSEAKIDKLMQDRVPPMTLDTLKEKNRELYRTLRLADAH